MRVVFVHPAFLSRGGAENLTVWLASGLAARGWHVTLAAAGIDRGKWAELDERVRTVELPDRTDRLRHQPSRSRTHGRLLAPLCREADVAVAGNYPSYWWVADALRSLPTASRPATLLLCQEPPRRFYFRSTDYPIKQYLESNRRSLPFHDEMVKAFKNRMTRFRLSRMPVVRWIDRRAVRWMDAVTANSAFSRACIHDAWGRDADLLGVGVPEPAGGEEVPFEGRHGVVVLTGFAMVKNPMGVLGAVDEIVNRIGRREIHFMLSGRNVPPEYRAFIETRGLADNVRFVGYVSEAEKGHLLTRARVCLFTPLAEPFGLVMVEAMLRGTPVVGSDHGGPGVTMRQGETGVLVDPFDPAAIARAVVDLYDDRARWEALGRHGRALARERFLLPGFVDRFEALVRRAIERRNRSP